MLAPHSQFNEATAEGIDGIESAIGHQLGVIWHHILFEPIPMALLIAANYNHVSAGDGSGYEFPIVYDPIIFIGLAFGAVIVLIALYWLKSLAGIDLFDGHFFLHGLFFD